jgi:hypothetical protein
MLMPEFGEPFDLLADHGPAQNTETPTPMKEWAFQVIGSPASNRSRTFKAIFKF